MSEQKIGVTIKLLKLTDKNLKTINEVFIENTKKLLMKFSKDGNLFAYMNCETHEVQVYDLRGWAIEELISRIKNGEALMKYKPSKEDEDNYDF